MAVSWLSLIAYIVSGAASMHVREKTQQIPNCHFRKGVGREESWTTGASSKKNLQSKRASSEIGLSRLLTGPCTPLRQRPLEISSAERCIGYAKVEKSPSCHTETPIQEELKVAEIMSRRLKIRARCSTFLNCAGKKTVRGDQVILSSKRHLHALTSRQEKKKKI